MNKPSKGLELVLLESISIKILTAEIVLGLYDPILSGQLEVLEI